MKLFATPFLRTFAYIVAAWTAVCLFNTEQTYITLSLSGNSVAWIRILGVMAPGMVLWASLTPGIMWLASRFPFDRWGIVVHATAVVACGAADASLYNLIDPWVNPFGTRPLFVGFVRYFSINVACYIGVVAFTLVTRYSRQLRERKVAAAELSSQLAAAQLRSLQAQLRPHFLFNTLNTVAELVHRDPESADRMITRLGALLRRSFDTLGDQEVSLHTELEFLRDYSEIVCARFAGRIRITTTIDPDALDAMVPSLILQPLVENAVRHGLEPRAEGGSVEIVARRRLDVLELEVRDDGLGFAPGDDDATTQAREGVGLRNTSARLQHLYGDAHRFSVRARVAGGTIVAIQIPCRQGSASPRVGAETPSRAAFELVR
jgi:two-component system, LytTR family, sensor kinase